MISSLRCSERFSEFFSHGIQLGACVHFLLRWCHYIVLLALRSTQFASCCGASRRLVLRLRLSLLSLRIACTRYRHVAHVAVREMGQRKVLQIRFHEQESFEWVRQNLLSSNT